MKKVWKRAGRCYWMYGHSVNPEAEARALWETFERVYEGRKRDRQAALKEKAFVYERQAADKGLCALCRNQARVFAEILRRHL